MIHLRFHEIDEEKILELKPKCSLTEEQLGPMPRSRYPLVIIMIRNDDDEGAEMNNNDVVREISSCQLNQIIKLN
jgi:hypothetical protein